MADLTILDVDLELIKKQTVVLDGLLNKMSEEDEFTTFQEYAALRFVLDLLDKRSADRYTPPVIDGLVECGKELEELGKKFQDPHTTVDEMVKSANKLGLSLEFRIG